MDTKIKIKIDDFQKARDFSSVVSEYESDIDIICGRYVIDAKSILGIYTLDLSKEVYVSINTNDKNEIERFNEDINKFRS